ncbi:MAG: helix-turn-helix domain-containing protein, partial [Candidatus Neomarinimicrobiota bacterium]|nr:helix-turn-helix domain-containing protein [Candidatus Neomarinimicrobiota bacterium]
KRMSTLLTPKNVSKILQLRYNKILALIKLGQLKAIRIDKSFRITEYDLHDFIEKNRYKSRC